MVSKRSLQLGQPVHDMILEPRSVNLVSTSINNARFWYYDVSASMVSYAPLEVLITGMVYMTPMQLFKMERFNGLSSDTLSIDD